MSYRITLISKKDGRTPRLDNLEKRFRDILDALSNTLQGELTQENEDRIISTIRMAGGSMFGTGVGLRTLCVPDPKLRQEQDRILQFLNRIPAHPSAHGFVRGRSAHSCAQAHTLYWGTKANRLVILNLDAKDFFPSCSSTEVRKALVGHGIGEEEADRIVETCMASPSPLLADAVLEGVFRALKGFGVRSMEEYSGKLESARLFLKKNKKGMRKIAFAICQTFLNLGPGINLWTRFLPQGAPTSPALSNLMMKLADIRLSAMARSFGGFYTRYADDLTVSWLCPTKGRVIDSMYRCAAEVLEEYQIRLNNRKKRVMGTGSRQDIVGYCVNSGRPTVTQRYRKKIRAALHNEIVRGSKRFHKGRRQVSAREDYSREFPTRERVGELAGRIGYIQLSHPEEARRGLQQLHHIQNRTTYHPDEPNLSGGIEINPETQSDRCIG